MANARIGRSGSHERNRQVAHSGGLLALALGLALLLGLSNKGGKIGIWTAGAPNAVLDDFGGDTVTP